MAVVGSGIAGLAAAHALAAQARVTLFEAGSHFGGHTHTVDVTLGGVTHGVDTGFLVFNHRTYPNLVRLFAQLQVGTAPAEMSFSVQAPWHAGAGNRATQLEWSGCNLNTVFAQRRNLLRPGFWRMLADVLRFNRIATALALRGTPDEMAEPLGAFLHRHRFSDAFCDGYLLPMLGCIWSCPSEQMLRFPLATMVRFCHNHGLIQLTNRPQWHTVAGGARHYVDKLLQAIPDARLRTPVRRVQRLQRVGNGGGDGDRSADASSGVIVATDHGSERFDDVVLACHSDQSLALLADGASTHEQAVLGAIRYHPNLAVLHTDTRVLPQRRRAWAAWNYARSADDGRERAAVCLHYLINRLQPLPWAQPVLVSLNPQPELQPHPSKVIGEYAYSHPVFDLAAIRAQRQLPALQGNGHVWFCGAWTGHGFHEDGLVSALNVVEQLRAAWAAGGQPSGSAVAEPVAA